MKEIQTIIGNTKVGIALIGLMLISLVSSCSKGDDDSDELQQGTAGVVIGGVRGYAPYFEENTTRTNVPYLAYSSLTRVWEKPSGFVDYEDGDQTIAIAFTQNNQEPKKGFFFKGDDEWRTSVKDIAAEKYYLYGYVPHKTVIKFNITDIDLETGTDKDEYSSGAIMTLDDVPSVMPNDLCVVVGAKDGTDKETDSGLRIGDFGYQASATAKDNFVFLLFDHLYASLCINMRVDIKYAELRTIKLKSLKLGILEGEDASKQKTKITIKLEANDGSSSPIVGDVSYEPTGEPIDVLGGGLEFWSDASGHELTTDYQSFFGHFMPSGVTTLVLTSKYDVYDSKGYLINKDCEATNTMSISDLYTGQTMTKRGKRYTVNMTIEPTYLYMLSDPDLDNPSAKVVP